MGYLAPENILENILQLMRFSECFEIILNKILLFPYKNNDIIAAAARMLGGFRAYASLRIFFQIVGLSVYFGQILS